MGCQKLTYLSDERHDYQTLPACTEQSRSELTSKNTLQTSCRQNLYRYNGKEKDEHTGLYEYGQRYYAPWLCRFVSVDPVAEKFADLSSYNYAGNRPITKRDQEGLQEEGRQGTQSGQKTPNQPTGEDKNNPNGSIGYNEVLGIDPVIITYKESQQFAAESIGTNEHHYDQKDLTLSDNQNNNKPVDQRGSSQASPVVKDLLDLGAELSPVFEKLMGEANIDASSFSQPIYYRGDIENSGTYPDGTIQLKYPNNNSQLIMELSHELSNRILNSEIEKSVESLEAGQITPMEFAQNYIDLEFLGQKNQILVAAEIGYQYASNVEGADELNALIERVANGESVNLDLELTPNQRKFNTYLNNAREILRKQENQGNRK